MTKQKHKFKVGDEVLVYLYRGTKLEKSPIMKGTVKKFASVRSSKYGNKILRLGYYIVEVNFIVEGYVERVEHVVHESRMKYAKEVTEFT